MAFVRNEAESTRRGIPVFEDDGKVDSSRNPWTKGRSEREIREAAQTLAPDIYSAAFMYWGRSEHTHPAASTFLKG